MSTSMKPARLRATRTAIKARSSMLLPAACSASMISSTTTQIVFNAPVSYVNNVGVCRQHRQIHLHQRLHRPRPLWPGQRGNGQSLGKIGGTRRPARLRRARSASNGEQELHLRPTDMVRDDRNESDQADTPGWHGHHDTAFGCPLHRPGMRCSPAEERSTWERAEA